MVISDKSQTQNLSLDEFLVLPETTPASEYIDGKIYQKPMPKGKHSLLQQGTKLGWLVDPKERLVLVFKPQQQPEVLEAEQVLPVLEVLKDLQLSADQLFSWLSFPS